MKGLVTRPGVLRLRCLISAVHLGAVALTGCHTRGSVPPEHAKVDADWRIDGCRVTYKGKILPLGEPMDSLFSVFGIPTDSALGRSRERHPFTSYYWDDKGLQAGSFAYTDSQRVAHIGINFSDDFETGPRPEKNDFRKPRGRSSVIFEPTGLLDSSTVKDLLRDHFPYHESMFGNGSYEPLSVPMGGAFVLTIGADIGSSAAYYGFSFSFDTLLGQGPEALRDQPKQTYRQVLSHLDSNCKLLPEHRDIASDSMKFERYIHRLDGIDTLIDSTTPGWSEIAEIKAKLDSLNAAKSGTFKRLREDLERAKKQRVDSARSKKK